MKENKIQWRKVVGYEGIYSISNTGIVRRDKELSFIKAGFILKPMIQYKGYYVVDLRNSGNRKTKNIAHLVMEAFVGQRPKGYQVNHKDGVKSNNFLSNLEYVTPRENVEHAHAIGLCKNHTYGERHSTAKLTWKEVVLIRKLYKNGNITIISIAKKYNMAASSISALLRGKTWKKK